MMGEIVGLLPAVSWAITPIFYRKGMKRLNPIYGNVIRAIPSTMITFVASFLLLGFQGTLFMPEILLSRCLLSGAIGLGVGDLMYLLAIKQLGAARAITVTSSYPLITLFLSHYLLGEEVGWMFGIGTLLVVSGIALISFNGQNSKTEVSGLVASTMASVLWSVSIILLNPTSDSPHPLVVNSWRLLGYFLFSLIPFFLLFKKEGKFTIDRDGALYLATGGIIAQNVGWMLYIYSIGLIGVSRATTLSSVSPLFTGIAEFVAERHFSFRVLSGTALATAGIIIVTV
ncbi:MAG: DMT family transporter [Nitrososphaeria archaeon]